MAKSCKNRSTYKVLGGTRSKIAVPGGTIPGTDPSGEGGDCGPLYRYISQAEVLPCQHGGFGSGVPFPEEHTKKVSIQLRTSHPKFLKFRGS